MLQLFRNRRLAKSDSSQRLKESKKTRLANFLHPIIEHFRRQPLLLFCWMKPSLYSNSWAVTSASALSNVAGLPLTDRRIMVDAWTLCRRLRTLSFSIFFNSGCWQLPTEQFSRSATEISRLCCFFICYKFFVEGNAFYRPRLLLSFTGCTLWSCKRDQTTLDRGFAYACSLRK